MKQLFHKKFLVRFGVITFLFFTLKGIMWLVIFYLGYDFVSRFLWTIHCITFIKIQGLPRLEAIQILSVKLCKHEGKDISKVWLISAEAGERFGLTNQWVWTQSRKNCFHQALTNAYATIGWRTIRRYYDLPFTANMGLIQYHCTIQRGLRLARRTYGTVVYVWFAGGGFCILINLWI